MDHVKVREQTARGVPHLLALPRMMRAAIPVPKPEGVETIPINAGRGRLCSTGAEIIQTDAESSFEFRYEVTSVGV